MSNRKTVRGGWRQRARQVARERIFQRTQDQSQRRAELMADVCEELRLQNIQLRQFLALPRDLALIRLLLRDVPALRRDEHHLPRFVLHRHQRRIDHDRLLPSGRP